MHHFPTYLLVAMLGRVLYFGASFGDALALLSLAALYAYQLYLKSVKQPDSLDQKVAADLAEMKNALSALKLGKAYGSR